MSADLIAILEEHRKTSRLEDGDGMTVKEMAARKFGNACEQNRRLMRQMLDPLIEAGRIVPGRGWRVNNGGVTRREIVYRVPDKKAAKRA